MKAFSKSLKAALAALIALWVAGGAAAGGEEAIAKPDVKVGDRWTYRRMDYWTNQAEYSYELRVTFVSKDAILASVTRKNGRDADSSWTSSWSAIVDAYGLVYTPEDGLLKFPLTIGAVHQTRYRVDLIQGVVAAGEPRVHHERKVTVKGWEDVVVPAGKFRALRIEADGWYQRLDRPVTGPAKNIIWYVPEVKRWVKFYFENSIGSTPFFKNGEELVEFEVR